MQTITKTASESGFMNFLKTLSGAFATLLVITPCQDRTAYACTGLSGLAGSSGKLARSMVGAGGAIRVVDPTTGFH